MEDEVAPSELGKEEYDDFISSMMNKVLSDELSSSILYLNQSYNLKGTDTSKLAEELLGHADDEMGHFKKLLKYCTNTSLTEKVDLRVDSSITNDLDFSIEHVLEVSEKLEKAAINDYKTILDFAISKGDYELEVLIKELLTDELGHLDDIQSISGNSRGKVNDDTPVVESEESKLDKLKSVLLKYESKSNDFYLVLTDSLNKQLPELYDTTRRSFDECTDLVDEMTTENKAPKYIIFSKSDILGKYPRYMFK